jgi:Glucosidase II beta subunit-like protein
MYARVGILLATVWLHTAICGTASRLTYSRLCALPLNCCRENFQCLLPPSATDYVEEDQTEENPATLTGLAVRNSVQAMDGLSSTCYYLGTGWWTYEVCPTSHISQYHAENGKQQVSFSLGDTLSSAPESRRVGQDSLLKLRLNNKKSIGTHYFSESYVHGDQCDLTGEPRRTGVYIRLVFAFTRVHVCAFPHR